MRGVERDLIKNKLFSLKASEYKKKVVLKANDTILSAHNLQGIKSDTTLRKIRSEARSQMDRDTDDMQDLNKMTYEHPEYIQEVAIPFNVKIYSLEQVFIAEKQKVSGQLPLLHFDATGSIVRRPNKETTKRIYLYSGVVFVLSNNRVCSVFEMISASHFVKSVFKILHDFRFFAKRTTNGFFLVAL